MDQPSDAATLERAHSLANEAVHMVALQRRRLQSEEPEDQAFIFRRWADFQFLVISLRRLRLAGLLAAKHEVSRAAIRSAIREFDESLPDLQKMRNVGEHIDDYAFEGGRDRSVDRRALQVGSFDSTTLEWLGERLNVDEALAAAENLYRAIKDALSAYKGAPSGELDY
ncbi:MAG: hypothetical protein WA862_07010 [Solirubrobacterales bacterium]